MLTLYGFEVSVHTNKVRFAANALGLSYEFKRVNLLAGEHKTESHLKLHPAGKVPVIQDGDFVLFESNAIMRYLAEKESSHLYPKDLRRRALVDQWIDFSALHIGIPMARVFVNRVAYKALKVEPDERAINEGLAFLQRFLPVAEAQLGKNGFLAGPEMTLADICLLAHMDPAEVSSVDLSAYPRLRQWQRDLQAKEFYQKCFPSFTQMLQEAARRTGT
jgi:glutathione S-transferase